MKISRERFQRHQSPGARVSRAWVSRGISSGNKPTGAWVSQRHASPREGLQGGPRIALFKKRTKKKANRANPVHATHQERQRGTKESHGTHYCKRRNRTWPSHAPKQANMITVIELYVDFVDNRSQAAMVKHVSPVLLMGKISVLKYCNQPT